MLTFAYDAHGLLLSMTRANGVQTTYGYDGLYRPTSVSAGGQTQSASYDSCTNGIGRLCSTGDVISKEFHICQKPLLGDMNIYEYIDYDHGSVVYSGASIVLYVGDNPKIDSLKAVGVPKRERLGLLYVGSQKNLYVRVYGYSEVVRVAGQPVQVINFVTLSAEDGDAERKAVAAIGASLIRCNARILDSEPSGEVP